MPNPTASATTLTPEKEIRDAALTRLRQGRNPFARQVTAVGTADESILASVPEFTANQLAELLEIIALHRTGKAITRAYPLLGERGAGKTHLLYTLRNTLREHAAVAGDETLLVIVERLSPGMDAIDYLLWQIVNCLLATKGDGARLLEVIAGRLTARVLGEGLRQLAPHHRVELIPTTNFFGRLGFGSAARAQTKLSAIDTLIQRCDAKHPTPDGLRNACDETAVSVEIAFRVITQHLDRTESKDVVGWLRRELYSRLARVALLRDRGPFEELQVGDFEDSPPNVKKAGVLTRRLLDTWLELLASMDVPVVVVFDQLEDYLSHPDPEQEKLSRNYFTDATARFVNELRNVCLLVFAEQSLWTDLVTRTAGFAHERLTQPIDLPGRAAAANIPMPIKLDPAIMEKLIQQRLVVQFADFDFTGLPTLFPFERSDVEKLRNEKTVRACLRQLAKRYDEIVFGTTKSEPTVTIVPEPVKMGLRERLADLWKEKLGDAAAEYGTEMEFKVSFIPEVQNALDAWLQCLVQAGLEGAGIWHKVELVTDTLKGQYGYLNVIRVNGPNAPGIGIAAWLGEKRVRPHDLKQRLSFFKSKRCPIKTLILLRADGMAALTGESQAEFKQATSAGRDVRVHKYEARHMHALMAFGPWHQIATAEVQNAIEADPCAGDILQEYLADLSKEWVGWVDEWCQPTTVEVSV